MTNITLTGLTPVHVQNAYGQGFALQNNGPGTAYLDNYTSVTPGTGQALLPGVTIPIAANADLWACTDEGETATLSWLAGSLGNGATIIEITGPVDIGEVVLAPGSEVGITGTVEVAGAVSIDGDVTLGAGSEVAISGPVTVSGPVDVSGSNVGIVGTVTSSITGTVDTAIVSGTVDIGTISGPVAISSGNVDIVNTPDVTAFGVSATLFNNPTITSLPTNTGLLDVGKYQSVVISWGIVGAPLINIAHFLQIQIDWVASDGTTFIGRETCYFFDASFCTYTRHVKGAYMIATVQVYFAGSLLAQGGLSVQGTTALLDETYVHDTSRTTNAMLPWFYDRTGIWKSSSTTAASENYPSTISGPASCTALISGAGFSALGIRSVAPGGSPLRYLWIHEAIGTFNGEDMYFPEAPCAIVIGAGASAITASFTFAKAIPDLTPDY